MHWRIASAENDTQPSNIASGSCAIIPVRRFLIKHPAVWLGLLVSVAFLLEGLALLPYPGIQNDEALFAAALYPSTNNETAVQVFGARFPAMLMSYLGTLKAWVCAPVFKVWAPSLLSIRIPVLLAGAVTVWLFFVLLGALAGPRAAVFGAALLATDTTFLLTTCFDWGPVALQHLLLVGGMVLLVRFQGSGRALALAAGCFLFGLAAWDKALFFWVLAGVAIAALVIVPREVLRRLTLRHAGIAALSFCLGALPLILYNLQRDFATFRDNARYSTQGVYSKLWGLRASLDGSCLFGYLVREQPLERAGAPETPLEKSALGLSRAAGQPRRNLMAPALLVAVLLLPWLRRTAARRTVLFGVLVLAAAGAQMLLTERAGASTHHHVLLWPFPHLVIAAALAAAAERLGRAGRPALVIALVVLCAASLVVTNEYLAQFVRNGPTAVWTDAVIPLSDSLRTIPASKVLITDWGIFDSLRLLNSGALPLQQVVDLLCKPSLSPAEKDYLDGLFASPAHLFITHTRENEEVRGVGARLEELAGEAGFRGEVLRVVRDRHGRAIFELLRYRKGVRRQESGVGIAPEGLAITKPRHENRVRVSPHAA
jgi:4-amino-4-deoxy-L-arabinose transferase-like glycosyltransferase